MPSRIAHALAVFALAMLALPARAGGTITVAAAADLKFAMDDIVTALAPEPSRRHDHVIYGSSGKFSTQIRQGAPFDLYFSADISYPQALAKAGLTASTPKAYAIGRIVLWSGAIDVRKMTLRDLAEPRFDRIAVANPEHAPTASARWRHCMPAACGSRSRSGSCTARTSPRPRSSCRPATRRSASSPCRWRSTPPLPARVATRVIPDHLYTPLVQGYVVTRRAANNPLAHDFASSWIRPPRKRSSIITALPTRPVTDAQATACFPATILPRSG